MRTRDCARRGANPAFALSLGSKELFHSILPPDSSGTTGLQSRLSSCRGAVTVLWEKDHTDLLIRYGQKQVTVIENYVYALPTSANSSVFR